MKVYQVVKSYYDGDHEHGSYRSPLFAKLEDAEAFREAVDPSGETWEDEARHDWGQRWWSDSGLGRQTEPRIVEMEVVESWDGEVPSAREARSITWT